MPSKVSMFSVRSVGLIRMESSRSPSSMIQTLGRGPCCGLIIDMPWSSAPLLRHRCSFDQPPSPLAGSSFPKSSTTGANVKNRFNFKKSERTNFTLLLIWEPMKYGSVSMFRPQNSRILVDFPKERGKPWTVRG